VLVASAAHSEFRLEAHRRQAAGRRGSGQRVRGGLFAGGFDSRLFLGQGHSVLLLCGGGRRDGLGGFDGIVVEAFLDIGAKGAEWDLAASVVVENSDVGCVVRENLDVLVRFAGRGGPILRAQRHEKAESEKEKSGFKDHHP
jgi:hypothetical protein